MAGRTLSKSASRFASRRRTVLRVRAWREWCFLKVAARHFRVRLAIMVIILLGGGLLFRFCEPEKNHSLPRATYYTWSLVFGEPPEDYPRSGVLQLLFFVVPVLGLTIIIEGIVDLALILRDRRRNERSWYTMMASSMKDHVILVGLGKLGYRTFLLLREMGAEVIVIERAEDNQFLDEIRHEGSPLFMGDARREALLNDANVAQARSIVLATNDDLANLEIALDARTVNPDIQVVLRMFDQNLADKVRGGFNIPTAMSQSAISAPQFAAAAIEPSIIGSQVIDGELVIMQRWQVRQGGPLADQTIGDVLRNLGFAVIERRRDGQRSLFPPPETTLAPGDELLVQGPFAALAAIRNNREAPA